jgi:hypothetical protein
MNTYTVGQKVTFTRYVPIEINSGGGYWGGQPYNATGVIQEIIQGNSRTETIPEVFVVNNARHFHSHELTSETYILGRRIPLEVGTKVSWIEVTKGHFDPLCLQYFPKRKDTYTGVITSITPKKVVTYGIPTSYVIKADFDGELETLKIGEIVG